mmetsp:Transcript_15039/g.35763  ORF Transcript_15039/g.35763 Transcript_15039/m.35763 type:complete len:414 (+) Transcript_15039:101-1342(+)
MPAGPLWVLPGKKQILPQSQELLEEDVEAFLSTAPSPQTSRAQSPFDPRGGVVLRTSRRPSVVAGPPPPTPPVERASELAPPPSTPPVERAPEPAPAQPKLTSPPARRAEVVEVAVLQAGLATPSTAPPALLTSPPTASTVHNHLGSPGLASPRTCSPGLGSPRTCSPGTWPSSTSVSTLNSPQRYSIAPAPASASPSSSAAESPRAIGSSAAAFARSSRRARSTSPQTSTSTEASARAPASPLPPAPPPSTTSIGAGPPAAPLGLAASATSTARTSRTARRRRWSSSSGLGSSSALARSSCSCVRRSCSFSWKPSEADASPSSCGSRLLRNSAFLVFASRIPSQRWRTSDSCSASSARMACSWRRRQVCSTWPAMDPGGSVADALASACSSAGASPQKLASSTSSTSGPSCA